LPSNAFLLVSISYTTAPNAKISVRASDLRAVRIRGYSRAGTRGPLSETDGSPRDQHD
jgi:hypothetical protein